MLRAVLLILTLLAAPAGAAKSGDVLPALVGSLERPQPRALCLARLAERGVVFAVQPPIAEPSGCAASMPLAVSALDGITLSAPAQMNCAMATALAQWTVEVRALAREALGAELTALAIGGAYECRGRNRVQGAKLSEHGFANAIDVMSFAFADRAAIAVTASSYPQTGADRFLDAVRQRACALFMTVLGPGADALHSDNLHLDLAWRRSGFRMCQ